MMQNHRTEQAARADGYTKGILAESSAVTLDLLVKPDANLDSTFTAFCRDEQEMIVVSGWLFLMDEEEPA